jgi:hypothetical protein
MVLGSSETVDRECTLKHEAKSSRSYYRRPSKEPPILVAAAINKRIKDTYERKNEVAEVGATLKRKHPLSA